MADRVVVDSRLGREGPRPAASPVDTFVQPKKESNLLSLAESLRDFAPAIGGLATAIKQKQDEKDKESGAGELAQSMQAGKSASEALAEINPAKSGAYKEGARKQAAQLSAFNYGSALNVFMTEKLADVSDLGEFNAKVQEFTQGWEKDNLPSSPEFAKDYARQAAAIRQNAVQQMSWRVGERLRERTEQEFGQLVGAAVAGEFNWTKAEGREVRIAAAVGSLRERAFGMGIQGSRINKLIFENVSSLGIAEGRPELIDTLYNVPTGPNGSVKLGEIPEFKEKIAAASLKAEANANRKDVAKVKTDREMGDSVVQAMNAGIIEALSAGTDPASLDITTFKQQMNEVDPTRVAELESVRQSFVQGYKRQTLPVIEEQLTEDLYDPDSPLSQSGLYERFEQGGMGYESYLKFRKLIESRDRIRSTRKALRPDQLMSEGLRMVGENVDGMGADSDISRVLKGRVRAKLRAQMYEWLDTEEGQKSNPEAIRNHSRLLAETLTAGLGKKPSK